MPTYEYCGRRHFGECMKRMGTCIRCGSDDHFLRDCPEPAPTVHTLVQTPTCTQSIVQTSAGVVVSREDLVTTHSIPYFALFDPGSTRSYVSCSVSGGLEVPVGNTGSHVIVLSPIGQSIDVDQIFRGFPIEIHREVFLTDLMELLLEEFELILGMDWLDEHQVNLNYEIKRVVLKTIDNKRIVMIGKYHLEIIQIVKEFPNVFLEELTGLQPDREVDFEIEVYSDDILVYSQTEVEHGENLRIVLQTMREHKLFVNLRKCEFRLSEVIFLGHIVSVKGILMDLSKVEAILSWKQPKNVLDICSFLVLTGYYHCFVEGFSIIPVPLTKLLRKDIPLVWSEAQ
ncbi:uncharacterized protein LOC120144686 [Hibiscus syriacus]|uniref:uncharacterized protein LOC120144686 n=1 Tax=Hibiscus syriacus TaxID=106335 RepID=UPI0019250BA4|nr:uncharacterized protein LOC120144686 [Hibiscus syriacus]